MPSYMRVSVLGSTIGSEVWSINPVFDPTFEFPGWNQAAGDAAAIAIAAIVPGSSLLTMMSSSMSITGIRLEARDSTSDALIGTAQAIKATAQAGTGVPKLPAQAATVISLRTDTPGGVGRGRLFWPALGNTIGSDLRMSTPSPNSVLTDMKAYLLAIRSALATAYPTIGFDLAVRSKTTHTTPHVTRLQVGNVIDTQRRRRDTYPEVYSSSTFPT
jgi:hypothetical protein